MPYDLGIWTSSSLADYCRDNYNNSWEAAENFEEHVQKAADKHGKTIYPNVRREEVPAPVQQTDESFTAVYPCDTRYSSEYPTILPWFRDWCQCEDTPSPDDDSNILLTSTTATDGGIGYPNGTFAVAQTGQKCAAAGSTYEDYGDQNSALDGIHTALHEVGHNVLKEVADTDGDDSGHHDLGEVIYFADNNDAITPMSSVRKYWDYIDSGDNGNECGTVSDTDNISRVEMTWSDCCVSNWY